MPPPSDPVSPISAPLSRPPAVPPPAASVRGEGDQRKGILLICLVSLIFAVQDGMTRRLGAAMPAEMLVMVRYWFMALFVTVLAARAPGGLGRAIRSRRPLLQIARGLLLVAEVVVMVHAFVALGLVETHAVFAISPLIAVALSVLMLGERVGWRRWLAVAVGFGGMLVILRPGAGLFSTAALLPLASAAMFALYGVLTRLVSRDDPPLVSFFWTGIAGAVAITVVGLPHWQPLPRAEWGWLAALCVTGAIAHGLMIRAYALAEASALQPFAYMQLVWATAIGYLVFHERVGANVVIGATIVVGAGLFTLARARAKAAQAEDRPAG